MDKDKCSEAIYSITVFLYQNYGVLLNDHCFEKAKKDLRNRNETQIFPNNLFGGAICEEGQTICTRTLVGARNLVSYR